MIKKYCSKHRLIHNSRYEAELYQADYLLNHSYNVPENWYETYKAYHCEVCNGWHTTTRARQTNRQFTIVILKGLETMDFEIKWDEPDELDESNTGSGSFPDWGLLKLVDVRNVTLFAGGEHITLPSVLVNGEPWKRGGIKDGGTTKLYLFTLDGKHYQTNEPFTRVIPFDNQPHYKLDNISRFPDIYLTDKQKKYFAEKGVVYVSDWVNLQKPVLAKLGNRLQRLSESGLWIKGETAIYDSWETGNTLPDGKPEKKFRKVWTNITVFETEAALLAAKAEEVGANAQSNGVTYPASWGDHVDVTMRFIGTQLTPSTDINPKLLADWKLIRDGKPEIDSNGKEVDIKAILLQAAGGNPLVEAVVNSWELKPF